MSPGSEALNFMQLICNTNDNQGEITTDNSSKKASQISWSEDEPMLHDYFKSLMAFNIRVLGSQLPAMPVLDYSAMNEC